MRRRVHSYNQGTNYTLPDLSNLIHYYRLESNAQDFAGTANASPYGSFSYGAGLYGDGIILNGTNTHIALPSNVLENTPGFSFSLLAKADNTNAEYRVVVFNDNIGMPFTIIRFNPGGVANRIQLYVYDGVAKTIDVDTYGITQPLHIGASILENGYAKLFVNGNLEGQDNTIGTFAQVSTNANVLGASRSISTTKLPGMMRGVGMWNVANTNAEMTGIAQKQMDGNHII